MSEKVKIDHPGFPKDHVFAIDGLGQFENGKEREVSDEEVAAYESATGKKLKEGLVGQGIFIGGKATAEKPKEEKAEEKPKEKEGGNSE